LKKKKKKKRKKKKNFGTAELSSVKRRKGNEKEYDGRR
jgi:hypothetical protein